jgi:transposase InsO family protein
VRFQWIDEHRVGFPVQIMCRVLAVSPSGYYAWRDRPQSPRRRRQEELAVRIKAVHASHRGVYGSPRVHRVLLAQGQRVCQNTVAKIMRQEQVRARVRRTFLPQTTDSRHGHAAANNRLDRDFAADRPDRKWVADITYVPTDQGWLYLAAVMDLCSRKIVGWSMNDHLKADLVSDALEMALARRSPSPGLLHHSDRGVQYACDEYQSLLAANRIECSMSRKGNCWDNAAMESFFATLKTELVNDSDLPHAQWARPEGRIRFPPEGANDHGSRKTHLYTTVQRRSHWAGAAAGIYL